MNFRLLLGKFLIITSIFCILSSAATQAAALGPDSLGPDIDRDGLSNEMEINGWYNEAGGPFYTNPLDADSDNDGLTDGQEKLFGTDPLDHRSPGIYAWYKDNLNTLQYFSATDSAYLSMRQGGNKYIMDEAMVARRGSTIRIGGPISATLSINTSGLSSVSWSYDLDQGAWLITLPSTSNGQVGTYTATLSVPNEAPLVLPIHVIFEIPTPVTIPDNFERTLTQEQIVAYLYDGDPADLRDEVAAIFRTGGYDYPAVMWMEAFETEHFQKFVFVDKVMPTIHGKSTQISAIDALSVRADTDVRVDYWREVGTTTSETIALFHDGIGWTQDGSACQSQAGVSVAYQRAAGIPANPFIVDWTNTTYDTSVMSWADDRWWASRSYTGGEHGNEDWKYYPFNNGITTRRSLSRWYQVYGSSNNLLATSLPTWDWQQWTTDDRAIRTSDSNTFLGGMVGEDFPAIKKWYVRDYYYDRNDRYVIEMLYPFIRTLNTVIWGWTAEPAPQDCEWGYKLTYGTCPYPLVGGAASKQQFQAFLPLVLNQEGEPSPIQIQRIVHDYGLDENGNGKFDHLVISVQVTVSKPGTYLFGGTLGIEDGLTAYGIGYAEPTSVYLAQGTHLVSLSFDGYALGDSRADGPYTIHEIWVTDQTSFDPRLGDRSQLLDIYSPNQTTYAYQADQFETLDAYFADTYTHMFLDRAGDNRQNTLAIDVNLDIMQAAVYRVEGTLYDGNRQIVGKSSSLITNSTASLIFDIENTAPPYRLEYLKLFDDSSNLLDSRHKGAYSISASPQSDLDRVTMNIYPDGTDQIISQGLTITPTQVFTGTVVDLDANGLYEQLHLDVQVQVGQAGQYQVEGWLQGPDNSLLVYALGDSTYLDIGMHVLALDFDGRAINGQNIDGPYTVVGIRILDPDAAVYTVLDQAQITNLAFDYIAADFEAETRGTVLFADDMENGSSKWNAQTPWTLHSRVWPSDSKLWKAQTSSGQDGVLWHTLPSTFDLAAFAHPSLRFQSTSQFPSTGFGEVQVSVDGLNWTSVLALTNSMDRLATKKVNLNSLEGQANVQFRFAVDTSSSALWYIDHVSLVAWPAITGASFTYPAGSLAGCTPIAFTATYTSVDTTLPITYTWDWDDGTTTVTSDPTVTHEFPAVGEYTVALTVENPYDGETATETVVIDIPCGPHFTSTPVVDATQDQPYVYNITVDSSLGGVLTITAPLLPNWLTLVDHGNRTATLSGTPGNSQVGLHALQLRVHDALEQARMQAFTLTVQNVNDPPILADTVLSVDENSAVGTLVGTLTATDIDVGDTLTYSIVGGNTGTAFAIDASSGQITVNNSAVLDYETTPQFVLTVQVIDSGGLTDTATITINLNDVNDAPVLAPIGDKTIDEMTLLSFTVVATDADIPANTLTFTLNNAPAGASIHLTTGKFSWTPTEAQGPGVYTVTIIVTDNGTPPLSDSETITITVNEVNAPPVANDDTYTVDEGGTLTVAAPGVLGNDTDSEGSPLTATLVSGVTHGTLTLDSSGAFTYTHDGSETLVDSFTYRASDGELESNIATVTININPINDPPVAVDDSYTVLEGGLLTVVAPGVLGNDIDPENGTLTATLIRQAAHGVVTLNPNGAFTYLHDGSETTIDDFEYQVCDGGIPVLCDTATVTIAITPVNDAPVANNDGYAVDEGDTLIVAAPGVLGNDSDAEGDPLQAVLVSGPAHGDLVLNSNGSFTYTHDGSETTADSFTYRASDGALLSNIATVTITINPINDPPVANDDAVTTPENTPIVIDVLANDSDPEGDLLTIIAVSVPANGTATHDGYLITYTPNFGFDGTDTFTYTISDGNGGTAQATVTVTVDDSLTTLTIHIVGQGSVERNPVRQWYDRGSNVTLTVHADPGWAFDAWSGDLSGTDNPATLAMTGNRTVTATLIYVGFYPEIEVATDAPVEATVGETVIYTISLSHAPTSDGFPLTGITVNSSITGPATYVSGDTDGDSELDEDETWIWTVAYTIQETDPNPLINVITVSAQDMEGDIVQAESTHSIAIVQQPTHFVVYLPLVAKNMTAAPAAADAPDLVVQQIRATSNSVEVVIKNQGSKPVVDGFWVDLYINPAAAPTHTNQSWNDLGSQGMVWGIVQAQDILDLGPGQTLTLRYNDAYYWASKSQVTWPLPAGSTVYVQVDSYNLASFHGGVLEMDEIPNTPYNNISGTTVSLAVSEENEPPLEKTGTPSDGDLPPR